MRLRDVFENPQLEHPGATNADTLKRVHGALPAYPSASHNQWCCSGCCSGSQRRVCGGQIQVAQCRDASSVSPFQTVAGSTKADRGRWSLSTGRHRLLWSRSCGRRGVHCPRRGSFRSSSSWFVTTARFPASQLKLVANDQVLSSNRAAVLHHGTPSARNPLNGDGQVLRLR
jgi:hypothetical protein